MADAAKRWRKPRLQFGALPFRRPASGAPEVMLITSRETRRWVIPKGWPIKGLRPHASAAQEAFEEAGLAGRIAESPIGSFEYEKRLRDGASVRCAVEVFPLEVERQHAHWPEQGQRDRRWFSIEKAAEAVREPGLGDIIRAFGTGREPAPTNERKAMEGGRAGRS